MRLFGLNFVPFYNGYPLTYFLTDEFELLRLNLPLTFTSYIFWDEHFKQSEVLFLFD